MLKIAPALSLVCAVVVASGCADEHSYEAASVRALEMHHTDSLGTPIDPGVWEEIARNEPISSKLLARVKVDHGVVEFYDFSPGGVLISGMGNGATNASEVTVRGKTVRDVWQELTNDAPCPPALEHALLAQEKLRLSERDENVGRRSSGTNVPNVESSADTEAAPRAPGGFCSTGYFTTSISGYGGPLGDCGSSWDFAVCLNNRTNNAWASHDDVSYLKANVCPYRGNILATVTSSDSDVGPGSWTVSEDYYRYWDYIDFRCDGPWFWDDCPEVRLDITEAAGDGYNWRFLVEDW